MKSKNIVFVHGIFGWGKTEMFGLPYWGKALKVDTQGFTVHEASCGPVSSYHDRACEVAAQLKGARVDYGDKHSAYENHDRFSEDFTDKELFQGWSETNPVILIAHSAGAHTCLKLQQLLADDYWGWETNANWIEAIVSIAGVINGSTLAYDFGCNKKTGLLTDSIGRFLGNVIQILALANGNRSFYDFDLDQWIGKGHRGDFKNIIQALKASNFAKGEDNLAFDLTLQGCYKANAEFNTVVNSDCNTYYLSFVTEKTMKGSPESGMNIALKAMSEYQGSVVNFEEPPIPGWGIDNLDISRWRENDGAVSSISQMYPFTAGNQPLSERGILNRESFDMGKWYYDKVESITGKRFDHLGVVFGYISDPRQIKEHKAFYEFIYKLLGRL